LTGANWPKESILETELRATATLLLSLRGTYCHTTPPLFASSLKTGGVPKKLNLISLCHKPNSLPKALIRAPMSTKGNQLSVGL
jgi:hypothetical protein